MTKSDQQLLIGAGVVAFIIYLMVKSNTSNAVTPTADSNGSGYGDMTDEAGNVIQSAASINAIAVQQ